MSQRYREGSRCQVMWEVYEKHGPEACAAKASSLNLSPNTVKGWLRMFGRAIGGEAAKPQKEAKPPKVDAEGKPVKKLPKRIGGYKFNPTGKKRVRCVYMPSRLGWLIEAGPEVSEVRWDDDFGEIGIINRDLKEVTPKEEEAWRKKYKTEVET